MGYNKDNYRRIKREYQEKALEAERAAETRRKELQTVIPELSGIDSALSGVGMGMFKLAMELSGQALEDAIKRLSDENEQLSADRASLLVSRGYPADYDRIKYECSVCLDTGFVGTKLCSCMRKALVLAGYDSSGIGKLIRTQSFDTFDPERQNRDPRAYESLKRNLDYCRSYAAKFSSSTSENLLFMGSTGLGKTHLSTAVAKEIIELGFDVVYDTAQNIFADFEYERFGRSYGGDSDDEPQRTLKYFGCDLLIIDDLGTELSNQFTVACLYNIVNTRVNRGSPTIINTNLGRDELRRRYADRITSRLFGEFTLMMFTGSDVRALKLADGNK
jgi:DNA replication protein